ncbi:MAG TPA: alpha/beta hydrolase [Streptosporangiaceae bacterium]|nr:alpha/beta hydrolase [Streptosporangiaceae bacterium]
MTAREAGREGPGQVRQAGREGPGQVREAGREGASPAQAGLSPARAGHRSPARLAGRARWSPGSGLRLPPAVVRLGVRQLGRRVLDPGLPWETQRRRLDGPDLSMLLPRGTTISERVLNGVPAEVVTAPGAGPERTVMHFHGGGYCLGSARTARAWAARLSAEAGCQVVLPEYRLAPEHRFPAALEDARHALSALAGEHDPASLVVSGDSAGGGLAMSLLLALREDGALLPAGAILLSPWLDLGRDRRAVPGLVRRDPLLNPAWLEACAAAYADPSDWPNPSVSPLLGDHAGLPPLLIQAGTDELLAPDAEDLAASASAAEVDVTYTTWPRLWHDFALQPGLIAAADSAVSQAAWFVHTVTGG